MNLRAVDKYLSKGAEKEAHIKLDGLTNQWDYVLCVPICGEAPDCLESMLANVHAVNALVIVVVNCPKNHVQSEQWHARNKLLMDHIKCKSDYLQSISTDIYFLGFNPGLDLLLVDRSTNERIDEKKGVGHARKIAADLALKLVGDGRVNQPWIFSTDADAVLPADYFICVNDSDLASGASALLLPFIHDTTGLLSTQEQRMYDLKLYYYRAGIEQVSKAYAYVPLGSTLIVSAYAYAQVRGFPARNAGEDFYILNKLAKVGDISQPQGPLIQISARISERVPFGTGPAVKALTEIDDPYNMPYYYHPQCFILLRQWQLYLLNLWADGLSTIPQSPILNSLYAHLKLKKHLQSSALHIQNIKRWNQFVHEWMDSFRMLKAIHFFSRSFAKVSLNQLQEIKAFSALDNTGCLKAFIEKELTNHSN